VSAPHVVPHVVAPHRYGLQYFDVCEQLPLPSHAPTSVSLPVAQLVAPHVTPPPG
jgi:hypothetical protein